MTMERDPSGGREQAVFDVDIRFITDVKGIEQATYNEETFQYLLFADEMPAPVRSYGIKVDGSGEDYGAYYYRSEIIMQPTNDGDDCAMRAFRNFLTKKEAHPIANLEYDTFVFASEDNFVYLTYQEDDGDIGFITCGSMDETKELEEQIEGKLVHEVDDEVEAAFDFLQQQEDMLTELYKANGLPISPIRLTVAPLQDSVRALPAPSEARVMLSDIAGLRDAKEQLEETILALKHPEVMRSWGVERPQGLLLYGPGGTAKTTLAKAVANELNAQLIEVKADEIYGKWMGESERNFRVLMNKAVYATRPTVLLFDEIDAIIKPNGGPAYSAVAGIFKQSMGQINNPNVIIMATSNEPDKMDPTYLRAGRFDVKVYVDLPNEPERDEIFAYYFGKYAAAAEDRTVFDIFGMDTTKLVAATEGMTGSDIETILQKSVTALAIKQIRTRKIPEPLGTNEILEMIRRHRQG